MCLVHASLLLLLVVRWLEEQQMDGQCMKSRMPEAKSFKLYGSNSTSWDLSKVEDDDNETDFEWQVGALEQAPTQAKTEPLKADER